MDIGRHGGAAFQEPPHPTRFDKRLLFLAFTSIGVVFGDIGTSPLYTIRECFHGKHGVPPDPANVLGVLSLVFWSMVVVVSIKYIGYILRADNRGEGGIFALLGLLPVSGQGQAPRRHFPLLLAGIIGAGLLYGDGIITPAISVLSAMEGLEVATKAASPFVVPMTCIVLIWLFLIQHRGTAHIGRLFGPIMSIWFLTIAALGIAQIVQAPHIFLALNPLYALEFFGRNGTHGLVVLGSVVLCITGCEALYADLGHFGRKAIRLSWLAFVFPALLCNYFGQGALLLVQPEMNANPFYGLVPKFFLYPMVAIATAATVIASQALISGVFSLTQQAVQLGLCPRIRVVHTSSDIHGQIYIPFVNYTLMVACIAVILAFKQSSGLAGAYGIAVTATMTVTSVLYLFVLVEDWKWSWGKALPLVGIFLLFDLAFLGGNLFKIADGGWFPLSVAAVIAVAMTTWKKGRAELARRLIGGRFPIDMLISEIGAGETKLLRVPGTAVFMTLAPEGTPPILLHHIKHNHTLHERVVLLTVQLTERPTVPPDERLRMKELGQGFYRVIATYGYMQKPDVPEIMRELARFGLQTEFMTTTYFLGREKLLAGGESNMMRWRKELFVFMSRNAGDPTAYFGIPSNRVVEMGAQIEL